MKATKQSADKTEVYVFKLSPDAAGSEHSTQTQETLQLEPLVLFVVKDALNLLGVPGDKANDYIHLVRNTLSPQHCLHHHQHFLRFVWSETGCVTG